MSSFTRPLIAKKLSNRLWEVYTPFIYYIGQEDSREFVEVEKGFQTDFASVPRFVWNLIPPDGQYTGAAVVHDYLYKTKKIKKRLDVGVLDIKIHRKTADKIFLEAMGVLGVPWWKRHTMYRAVRLFGGFVSDGWPGKKERSE